MASSKTSLSSESDGKGQGVNLALLIIGRKYVTREGKQMEILRIPIVEKKDAVLLAGFGKSFGRHSLLISWIILASDGRKQSRLYWLYHLLMF